VALKAMVESMKAASPFVRICHAPAYGLTYLLERLWMQSADFTSDRLLLLMTQRRTECLATIMKLGLQENRELDVQFGDVEAFLARWVDGADETTASARSRMRDALGSLPSLNARVRELFSYSESSDYKYVCQRMSREKLTKAGSTRAAPNGTKTVETAGSQG
jgi:hypothetical protein